MNNLQLPTARKNGIVVQDVPNEVLVYDLESNKAHCLNQTAAMVWNFCDGKNSVSDIAALIGSSTGKHVSDDFVWLAIDQLAENNLLENGIKPKFAGETRREIIKKIGLGTVVALPIIASLVAPKSVLANVSCICAGTDTTDCFLNGSCATNFCVSSRCSATP